MPKIRFEKTPFGQRMAYPGGELLRKRSGEGVIFFIAAQNCVSCGDSTNWRDKVTGRAICSAQCNK